MKLIRERHQIISIAQKRTLLPQFSLQINVAINTELLLTATSDVCKCNRTRFASLTQGCTLCSHTRLSRAHPKLSRLPSPALQPPEVMGDSSGGRQQCWVPTPGILHASKVTATAADILQWKSPCAQMDWGHTTCCSIAKYCNYFWGGKGSQSHPPYLNASKRFLLAFSDGFSWCF